MYIEHQNIHWWYFIGQSINRKFLTAILDLRFWNRRGREKNPFSSLMASAAGISSQQQQQVGKEEGFQKKFRFERWRRRDVKKSENFPPFPAKFWQKRRKTFFSLLPFYPPAGSLMTPFSHQAKKERKKRKRKAAKAICHKREREKKEKLFFSPWFTGCDDRMGKKKLWKLAGKKDKLFCA